MVTEQKKVGAIKRVNARKLAKGPARFPSFGDIGCHGRVAERNKKTR